jgi:hypothetical protein
VSLLAHAAEFNFSLQDLYVKSEVELVHSVELLPWEIERLYTLVGSKICAPPQTALELWRDARACPPPLNIFGAAHPLFAFPSRTIIEIVRAAFAPRYLVSKHAVA